MKEFNEMIPDNGFIHKCRSMTREDLKQIKIEPPDADMYAATKKYLDNIAKPLDSLGDFEHFISRCGAMTRKVPPTFAEKAMVIMIADNGVVKEGISQSGQDVTKAVAFSMGRRASSVCKMCAASGARVVPVDIGIADSEGIPYVLDCKVAEGTKDFLEEPAMTESEVMQAIMTGIELAKMCADSGITMLGTGEMGIGNTTTSCAVTCALLGCPPARIVGRGAGASDEMLARKQHVIEMGLEKYGFMSAEMMGNTSAAVENAPGSPENTSAAAGSPENSAGAACGDASAISDDRINRDIDAFEVLRCVGGLDLAGLAGVFIGGALSHVPVVIDGVISGAAALIAEMLVPGTKDYMLASHLGAEPALPVILRKLGLKPVIDARMALGEGTGAALFFSMMDTVMTVVSEAASFNEIAVEQYTRFS